MSILKEGTSLLLFLVPIILALILFRLTENDQNVRKPVSRASSLRNHVHPENVGKNNFTLFKSILSPMNNMGRGKSKGSKSSSPLAFLNELGRRSSLDFQWSDFLVELESKSPSLSNWSSDPFSDHVQSNLSRSLTRVFESWHGVGHRNHIHFHQTCSLGCQKGNSGRVKITLVTIACGKSVEEGLTMIKSAAIFSADADLHVIVFSDKEHIRTLGQKLLELKLTVSLIREGDFTFELKLDWFPTREFRELWAPCASQRIFFPGLLQDVDSMIYIDADAVILSNLTELWLKFQSDFKSSTVAAFTRNMENGARGFYGLRSQIPFYPPTGINAGIMLLNLTRAREFHLMEKTLGAFELHRENIWLADQDMYNIVFHSYPERVVVLDCIFNFLPHHCGQGRNQEYSNCLPPFPTCFCHGARELGVKIVHGNRGAFFTERRTFWRDIYRAFLQLDLLDTPVIDVIRELKESFEMLKSRDPDQCFSLTADNLYGNAETYLNRVYRQGQRSHQRWINMQVHE